jgi:hypothetical protein
VALGSISEGVEGPYAPPIAVKRIGVLSNLRAGRNAVRASKMLALLGEHPDVVHVQTRGDESVAETLREFTDPDVDLLVVNGGDGTLQQALTVMLDGPLFRRIPLVAPLRGGRTNMSAIDLGCQRDPVKAVAALLAAARGGRLAERLEERPVLRIESQPERLVQYGMFCGLGVIHRAVELVHRAFPAGPRSQGALGAGMLTGFLVARLATRSASGILVPDPMRIVLDGMAVARPSFQLVITTTLRRLFLGINPFWGREPAPVRVTTMAFGAHRMWASAVGILRGRPRPHVNVENGYTSRNVERAEFHADCGLCVDGELFAPRPGRVVRIEADHRVRFIRA